MPTTKSPYKRRAKLTVRLDQWRVNDIVQVGATRWIVRIVDGQSVELEASNVSPGIWWRTTLDRLPAKEPVR
jgi:hypothetical protein